MNEIYLPSLRERRIINNITINAGKLTLEIYNDAAKIHRMKGKHDFALDADIKSMKFILRSLQSEKNLYYLAVFEEEKEENGNSSLDSYFLPSDLPEYVVKKCRVINTGWLLHEQINGKYTIIYGDPLEASHNYKYGRKDLGFGVTLGLVKNGCIVYVVYYNPVRDELYSAMKGNGAYLSYRKFYKVDEDAEKELFFKEKKRIVKRIHAKQRKVATGPFDFMYADWPSVTDAGAKFLDKLRGGGEGRITDYPLNIGSDVESILMVCKGQADGLVFPYENGEADIWDIMFTLFAEEVGLKATDFNKGPWYVSDEKGFVKTTNGLIIAPHDVHPILHKTINK